MVRPRPGKVSRSGAGGRPRSALLRGMADRTGNRDRAPSLTRGPGPDSGGARGIAIERRGNGSGRIGAQDGLQPWPLASATWTLVRNGARSTSSSASSRPEHLRMHYAPRTILAFVSELFPPRSIPTGAHPARSHQLFQTGNLADQASWSRPQGAVFPTRRCGRARFDGGLPRGPFPVPRESPSLTWRSFALRARFRQLSSSPRRPACNLHRAARDHPDAREPAQLQGQPHVPEAGAARARPPRPRLTARAPALRPAHGLPRAGDGAAGLLVAHRVLPRRRPRRLHREPGELPAILVARGLAPTEENITRPPTALVERALRS